jgi:two-component system chemotaxis response regulator CheB
MRSVDSARIRSPVAPKSAPQWAIVIGGSAGALTPLRTIVRMLPAEAPAACFVVIHTSAWGGGHIADIVRRESQLTITRVAGPERVRRGCVYIAGPDRHLRVTPGGIDSTREAREHHVRPAVDVLFRSAARAFGARVEKHLPDVERVGPLQQRGDRGR